MVVITVILKLDCSIENISGSFRVVVINLPTQLDIGKTEKFLAVEGFEVFGSSFSFKDIYVLGNLGESLDILFQVIDGRDDCQLYSSRTFHSCKVDCTFLSQSTDPRFHGKVGEWPLDIAKTASAILTAMLVTPML
jgi:hypothetical protein